MGQRVGAVVIAHDASLMRVGAWTGLEWTLTELRRTVSPDALLVVSDSLAVQRLVEAWGVRWVRFSDVEEAVWVQASGERSQRKTAAPAAANAADSPVQTDAAPTPATGLARVHAALRPFASPTSGVLAELDVDIIVVVDASCPLWDAGDYQALVAACAESNRAVLVTHASRVWLGDEQGALADTSVPGCVELDVLRALRVVPRETLRALTPVLVEPWKAWSLREPTERLALRAVWQERDRRRRQERLPKVVAGLVMDFDGVLTDNRVLVDQQGTEAVWCHRGDGLGIELLRKSGLPMLVISKEQNPVVQARCKKLQIPCLNGIDEKLAALQDWCQRQQVSREQVVFVGNDINDLECLSWAGCGVAVHDCHPEVQAAVDLVLENVGGRGAVRELAELILLRNGVRLLVRTDDDDAGY